MDEYGKNHWKYHTDMANIEAKEYTCKKCGRLFFIEWSPYNNMTEKIVPCPRCKTDNTIHRLAQ